MKRQRPIIAFLMVLVFGFNMLGYCLFSVLILTHKKSVFNKIVSGDFEKEALCSFKEGDLKNASWEHEKEFELNGEMYDVVKKESKDGSLLYTCKKDGKEDHLKKQKRKAAEKSAAKKMVEMAKIFVQEVSTETQNIILSWQTVMSAKLIDEYSFYYSSPANPPPKG